MKAGYSRSRRNHHLCLLALALIVLPAARSALAETINVSAAVSMKEAMTDIARSFEAETHDHVSFTFGASGQLAAQISNGAPVDLFISAGTRELATLSKAGLVDDASWRVVAGNELVLIVPVDARSGPSSFKQLNDAKKRGSVSLS